MCFTIHTQYFTTLLLKSEQFTISDKYFHTSVTKNVIGGKITMHKMLQNSFDFNMISGLNYFYF